MKYALTLALGILTGMAFSRIPHYPLFRDVPKTPDDWAGPKVRGSWNADDVETMNRYFNGGRGAQ